jgi:hypothetical protein
LVGGLNFSTGVIPFATSLSSKMEQYLYEKHYIPGCNFSVFVKQCLLLLGLVEGLGGVGLLLRAKYFFASMSQKSQFRATIVLAAKVIFRSSHFRKRVRV